MTEVGKFLKKLRIDNNEILFTMAQKLGVTSSFLSAVELGKKKMPYEWNVKIRSVYHLTPSQEEELDAAIAASEKAVIIDLEKASPDAKKTAVSFARSFEDLTDEQLESFTGFVKEHLEGVPVDVLSDEMLEKLQTAMGTYLLAMSPLVQGLFDMSKEIKKRDIDVSGAKNLIGCKEIDQHELMSFIDDSEGLMRLVDDSFSGINVVFSEENDSFLVSNTSLVSSNFLKDGKVAGHLGVIGPMRIDYKKIIPYVEFFTERISEILSSNENIINEEYEDNEDAE